MTGKEIGIIQISQDLRMPGISCLAQGPCFGQDYKVVLF